MAKKDAKKTEIALGRLTVLSKENETLKKEIASSKIQANNWLTPDQIDLIRRTYVKGSTDDEFKLFLEVCRMYQLSPIKREIFFSKFTSKQTGQDTVAVIVGRDGYLSIAHKTPSFNGLSSGVIEKDGKLWGAYCEVSRKDWTRPLRVEVKLSEYNTGRNLWATMPATMITKVAESQALRKAFNVSGVYSEEELEQARYGTTGGVSNPTNGQEKPLLGPITKPDDPLKEPTQEPKITSEDQLRIKTTINQICKANGWELGPFIAEVKRALEGAGYSSLADLPQAMYLGFVDTISKIKLEAK